MVPFLQELVFARCSLSDGSFKEKDTFNLFYTKISCGNILTIMTMFELNCSLVRILLCTMGVVNFFLPMFN